jgi:hypothetical protein
VPPGTKLLNFFAFDVLAQRNNTLTLIYRLRAQLNRELNRDYKQYDQFKKQDAATAVNAAVPPYPEFTDEEEIFKPHELAPPPEAPLPNVPAPNVPAPESTAPDPAQAKPQPDAVPDTHPDPPPSAPAEAEHPDDENSRDEGNAPPLECPQRE